MAFWPLTIEIIITFVLSSYLLNRFGNWVDQNIITTVSVFISWFFSFIVIFILPLDISTTTYLQCLKDYNITTSGSAVQSHTVEYIGNVTNLTTTPFPIIPTTLPVINPCEEPWSYAPNQVLPTLWRIVYWTAQVLTWIVLPLMQSYSMAGEFTVGGKLKAALIDNAIYYGSFAIIFIVFIIYVSIKTQLNLEGIKIICITASNTWGLFLLVVLLGYGLVEIPRSCFNSSHYGRTLSYLYFKVAKLSAEKCESDEKLDDVLEEIQTCLESLSGDHDPMRPYLDIIVDKCPPEWKQQMMTRLAQNSSLSVSYSGNAFNEKSLTRMHKNIIQAMQTNHRTHCQWDLMINQSIEWEDVAKNEVSLSRLYRPTIEARRSLSPFGNIIRESIYTPKIEWYWKCMFRSSFYRVLGYVLTVFSLMVVWETAFTQIMGHLDVISFIGDIFNVYLPLCICLLCLSTFFEFGAKVLHNLGFEQFILTDEMTAELIREGQELVKREKNKALRHLDHNTSQPPRPRKPIGEQQPLSTTTQHITSRSASDDRQELMNEAEPIGYSSNWNYDSTARPQKGLFDDI
ncbi:unnamed protein product [Oppiella nova]|uniref:LMBR1 domain-containing protein 2 n=1 Tax=Oppiella nova TaxID=334625 RepID=A0A7R9QHG0_9ACAR|nr:unnamed protein product [Oppiella nova]CAG2165913.1 unnamed protein product [Oppiella nova]